MFCTKCGSQLADDAKFCTGCGAPVEPAAPAAAPVEPVAAPAAAPVEPAAPVAEAPAEDTCTAPEPTFAPAPAPEKKPAKGGNKKPLLFIGVAVVAVIAAIVTFFAWIHPTYLSKEGKLARATSKAESALAKEDYEEAVAQYTAALKLVGTGDEDARAKLFVGRGDAYMGMKDYAAAAEDYEEALDLDEDQKKVWGKLSDAYLEADDDDAARDALERGYDITGASSLQDKLSELGEPVAPPANADADTTVVTPDRGDDKVDAPTHADIDPTNRPDTVEIGGETYDTSLTSLTLMSCGLTDISNLRYFTELEWLDLEDNDITDVSPLAGLTNLKTLYLGGNDITDISPLAGLTNLELLDLQDNNVRDISALAGMTELTWLGLWYDPVSDISPLANLKKLERLDLDDTLVSDVSPLFGLTELSILYISGDNLPEDAWDQIAAHLPQFGDSVVTTPTVEEHDWILDDEIRVGLALDTDANFNYESDGYLYGFAIDLGEAISERIADWGYPTCSYYGYEDTNDAFNALYNGEVDCLLINVSYESIYYASLSFTEPYGTDSYGEYYGIIVEEGEDELCEVLSAAIETLVDDGTVDALVAAYSG